MEAKKNPDLDLNHNSSLYFSIGLCLMLFVTNSLLNFKTYDKEDTIAEILEMSQEVEEDIQFDHLFLGTNREYYKTVQKVIDKYPDHGILTYPQKYLDLENNNLRCPVDNLLGKFKTYVYTKNTFDPAPRLFQEARWLGKEIIYLR